MKTSMNQQNSISRRRFVGAGSAAVAGAMIGLGGAGVRVCADVARPSGTIFKSIKIGMFNENITLVEKFQLLKDMGFDGIELNSPGGVDKTDALKVSRHVGLPIHGVVNSIHWSVRLSDPDEETRSRALEGLLTAIREAHMVGGSAVLLVPGKVNNADTENHGQVWRRSIDGIRKALPLAAKLGIHILIENVWNNFLYDPKGPDNQSAALLAAYLDEINSPWVGSYFDIGNHQRFGRPADWIRTLGRRIVKLDVKDWGKETGFSKIGDGDVDWADVRAALKEIQFTGWATAEVAGGDRNRIKEVGQRMDRYLLGVS